MRRRAAKLAGGPPRALLAAGGVLGALLAAVTRAARLVPGLSAEAPVAVIKRGPLVAAKTGGGAWRTVAPARVVAPK